MTRSKYWNLGLGSALLVAALIVAWLYTGGGDAPLQSQGPRDPVPVVTQVVASQPFTDTLQALGTIRANASITVTSEVASTVEAIRFNDGQFVDAGAVLVSLEDAEARANLAAAEAALVDSRSQYERSRQLRSSGAVSASQLQQLEARMNADAAQVEAARSRLADHTIRASFAGRVGLRQVSVGSLIQPGTAITTLDDIDPVQLDFSVPGVFIGTLATGQAITARSEAYPEREFTGQVLSIATRVDPVSRALTVRAELPNADGALKPGMFLTVTLIREIASAVLIPEQAIIPENQHQYVYVVQNGAAQKREVQTGRRQPGVVEILSGLAVGEIIVTDGAHKLVDGMLVAGTTPDAEPAT